MDAIADSSPLKYQLFDAGGNLLISSISLKSRDIWGAGSEVFNPLTAAFVTVGNAADRADQNSVVALNFAELSAFNGLTMARGYVFDSQLAADTEVYRISFAVTPVPEPETYALLLAGLGMVGMTVRRRARGRNAGRVLAV